MQLLVRIRAFVDRHDLARGDTRVVVALSGGSDSVALTYLLRDLDAAGRLRVVGLAHFNHQLRAAADEDERFSVGLAESLGWPIRIEREDVAARARRERRSLENAARTARHAFYERARAGFAADAVALGHTRDDQAETFLLRLLRGAGPRGLAAMHPRNGSIIRPLLACRRSELRAYLDARAIAYVEDESNADVSIPRNRVRAELLPLLEARFNPGIVDVLADEAELARDVWRWMEVEADDLVARSLKVHGSPVPGSDVRLETSHVDVPVLMAAPLALRRFVVWRAMTEAARGRPVSFAHVEAALGLTESEDAGPVDAPGQRVERVGPRLVLRSRPAGTKGRPAEDRPNFFQYALSIPGEVLLSNVGCAVSADVLPAAAGDATAAAGNPEVAFVRSDLHKGQWQVRNRRPGDRFHPVGLGGQKKLQDFFVDRKVARQRRDLVPLVVDETDRIVWVAGYGIDAAFQVTDAAQAVILLRLKLLGGTA